MTFEGFDAAPLIETGGFTAAMAAIAEMGAPDAATLDAALRAAARAERAEATILDLWVDRPGASNFRSLEGPAFGSGTSRLAWALADGHSDVLDLSVAKSVPLFAAFGDDEGEDEEIVVKGNRTKNTGTGDETGGGYGDGSYGDGSGGDIGEGGTGTNLGGSSSEKVADHTQKCGTDDGAAVQVAKHVMGTPPGAGPPNPLLTPSGLDWMQVEFGAVIVRGADGRFGALNDAIYSNELPGLAHLPNFAGTDAVGIWHNHIPRGGPTQNDIDRYPSFSPTGHDDWDALQQLKDTVAPNDPNFDPSLWITGPDGVTREFKLSERGYYESLTADQMQADEGLDGKERTQSCT